MTTTFETRTAEQFFVIPGTDQVLTYVNDPETGRLQSIVGGGRLYWERLENGALIFDAGWIELAEFPVEKGFARRVKVDALQWQEVYLIDGKKRPTHVDGVDIIRDPNDRVVACIEKENSISPRQHEWFYSYQEQGLVSVEGPEVRRQIALDENGRVLGWRGNDSSHEFSYDENGVRRDASPLPRQRFHRDTMGRLWTITDNNGNIESIFLWEGFRCFARIDGPLGTPLGAVFSLDPTATPVRIIDRNGMTRIPRDAFGEGLLAQDRVPGLFGAMVWNDLAHLPWRVLDPKVGAFCSPDPFDGNEDDPRRGENGAWAGPLPVEPDGEQRFYTVCRNDPVGRADPTGAISAGLVISDISWSLQNNILTFFGLDWTINFLTSLLSGFQKGNFGSSEHFTSSERMGSSGFRRDGVLVNHGTHAATGLEDSRAFTTQHIVWATANDFILLERGRVIDPTERFEPTLYGTVLLARPADQIPFILAAGGPGAALDWSRNGGPAEPIAPGAVVPKFPRGGFHFNVIDPVYSSNINCPLTELIPGTGVALGTLQDRAVINLPTTVNLSAGDLVLLSDAQNDLVMTQVASSTIDSGRRLIRLDNDAPNIGPNNVTMMILETAPAATETRAAEAAVANAFTVVGAGEQYSQNDLLRFTDNGTGDITIARIERLEARLPLDRTLPNGFTAPIQIATTMVNPATQNPTRTGDDTLEFPAGTAPAVGSLGLVSGGGQQIPVRVLSAPSADTIQVDTNISAASAVNDPVDYQIVTGSNPIGERNGAPEGAAQVTYTPSRSGSAPDGSAGTVILRITSGTETAVRRVTAAAAYDAAVADRAITGPGPWQIERFVRRTGTTDSTGLTITRAASVVARPSNVVEGAAALRLQLVNHTGAPPALAASANLYANQTINGNSFTANLPPSGAGSHPANPGPGEVVLATDANGSQPLLVQRVRVTPTFDRTLDVEEENLSAVLLTTDGFTWPATRVANRVLTVDAQVGTVDVQFPRFQVGETVQVAWDDGTAQTNAFRISAVQGLTITLEGGPNIAAAAAANPITVRRLIPDDPGTNDTLLARDGNRVGAAPSNQITFSVWAPNAFPEDRIVGIISGDRTLPAIVDGANQDCEVIFSADPGMTNPVSIGSIAVADTGFAARFVREDDTILITDDTAGLTTGANQELLITPFVTSDVSADNARLHPGSLLVPQDEGTEIDRRQSLIDHELMHTIQYSKWGPLWFCFFPTFILELGLELGTDTDLPEYTPFHPGKIEEEGSNRKLTFTAIGLPLEKGDDIQLVKGGSIKTAEVLAKDNGTFILKAGKGHAPLFTGNLQVRKRNSNTVADVFMNIFQGTTHGGLVNYTAGSFWGAMGWLLAKLGYVIVRAIKGTADVYPADVKPGNSELELTDEKGQNAVHAGQIIIKKGKSAIVRSAVRTDNTLTLDQPIKFNGAVNVAPYSTEPDSKFNWFSYYPANVVNADNPFVIRLVPPTSGKPLELKTLHRVEIKYQDKHFRTTVVSITGADIGLADPVPITNSELSLRIAKIGKRDPMGNADSAAMDGLGLSWMRWIFDPWGQIQVEVRTRNTWLDVFLHAVRYVMGTQNWSVLAPPFLGYVFWFRLFRESESHLTAIEQEASEESGDLYSPLGRLYGQCRQTGDYGHYTMVVGDVARYYYWAHDSEANFVAIGNRSQPGVHVGRDNIRIIPFPDGSGATAEPNGTTQIDPGEANPGIGLSDLFVQKNAAAPHAIAGGVTGPTSFRYSDRGLIPTAATTQRHIGGYAAFTRAGDYRVTTQNGIGGAARGREAHEDEAQTLFFNITVVDVTVTINGTTINEGDTIDLVQTQEVTVNIEVPSNDTPGGTRQFRTTLERPDDGTVLRQSNNRVLVAQTTNGTEKVELSRFYDFNEDNSTYSDESFSRFGVNLGGDIHIPVRQFNVRVVDTLPLRADSNPASGNSDLTQGQTGFLFVPAAVVDPPAITQFDGRAHQAADPAITISPVASPAQAVTDFIGGQGAAFEVSFAAAPAVAGPTPVVIEVRVGSAAAPTTLTCSFNLIP